VLHAEYLETLHFQNCVMEILQYITTFLALYLT
jgi:hypothetical protein